MSIDTLATYPAPADTASVENTVAAVGIWEAFVQAHKPMWAAERAAHCAEVRADLAATPAKERTAEDALTDVRRYKAMLQVPAVIASAPWTRDVEAKLANARAELGRFRRAGAR